MSNNNSSASSPVFAASGPLGCSASHSQIIQESRRRSSAYGVNVHADVSLDLQISPDILRKENALLLGAADPVLEHLSSSFSALYNDSIFILANSDAVILSVQNSHVLDKAVEITDVAPGVDWSESRRGTNALGTALVAAQSMLIGRGEHYLERLENYSCSSVLLNDVGGEIMGVLALARKGALPTGKDSLLTLALTASYIERRLFINSQAGSIILAVHNNPLYLDSPWQGLLSLDANSRVLALNDTCCELFGVQRKDVLGPPYTTFLRGRPPSLSNLTRGLSGTIKTVRGNFTYRILALPEAGSELRSRSVKDQHKDTYLLTGCSDLERNLLLAKRAFNNDLPILLLGETGTGKEVVARTLHAQSPRADKPFVAVNCAAIPEGLIESELFGYKDGAFTGARRGGMVGRLEQANGGTLFLDEIGDMPVDLQGRLLRVLQERLFSPLGAAQEQPLDVGLICATHQDLKQQIANNCFREDLYYRINGVRIQLPALRDRNDVMALCRFFLTRENLSHVQISEALEQLLSEYHWPGNIRQLEMVVRVIAAVIEPGQKLLEVTDLPDSLLEELRAEEEAGSGLSIRDKEEELIRRAMAEHEGNVSAAARELGVSRATLYRKIKQLNLDEA